MRQPITIFSFLIVHCLTAQDLQNLDDYSVDKIYQKVELDYGTLDENGYDISYIYVPTELDQGKYDIEITDADGDLYQIKGTDLFISFNTYYGYAGYGDEGILMVESYSSTFYKLDD